jgi:DNA-binding HxlR family transcriptional regulator
MMNEIRIQDLLKLVGSKGTIHILRVLNEHEAVQYKQLREFMNICTLNKRVKQLLEFNLISHHLEKKDVRKEWYEITEKGKRTLEILEEMVKIIKE